MPKRRVLLYLYVPVPSSLACTPVIRSPFAKLKNRVRRAYDFWQWRALRNVTAHYSSHSKYKNSNRGDIAIGYAIQSLIKNHEPELDFCIKEIGWHDLNTEIIEIINETADIFVIGGGGYFHAGTDGKIFQLCYNDLPLIQSIKIPKFGFCLGVNRLIAAGMTDVNELNDKRSLELLRKYSKTLEIIAVRDRYSMRSFEKAGARNVHLVADPVFFWEESFAHENVFDKHDIIQIGINFAFHGEFSTRIWKRNVELYLSFLHKFSKKVDARFVYFLHSDEERYVIQSLLAAGLNFDVVDAEPLVMLSEYAKLDIHIGQMMHSCIMAASVHVPVISLAYDTKNSGFFNMIGMDDYVININEFTVESLMDAVYKLIERRAELASFLRYRQLALRDDLEDLLNKICRGHTHLEKCEDPAQG